MEHHFILRGDMARTIRQSKILELISRKSIETQEELVEELNRHKFKVTQATISRDIKELGLIKIMDGKNYRYAYIESEQQKLNSKLINLFRESVISINSANNLIVIRTLSGSANAAAMAIDKLNLSTILGSIAGDDTLLIVVKTNEDVEEVVNTLNGFIN